ncbi:YbaK/EbsC family protein [Clostridiisalibacter paucivorans]|uniref:YbaK/EbsC family protein n=1 Tax=Clostridiisalibacter paucivorans TaxID=408753 RepID=UPI00047B4376|nr:YbaK/EbsC family protein [Clostridiisalibacter paucivorans]
MGVEKVRSYFKSRGIDFPIYEFDISTATVDLAAQALGVKPALIAKTMAFKLKDRYIVVVTKGDARIDNRKFKDTFLSKAKMVKADEVLNVTGYPVGGVCPFGLKEDLDIYLDMTLKEFEYVYPAAGTANSAVKITPEELMDVTSGIEVDVCK